MADTKLRTRKVTSILKDDHQKVKNLIHACEAAGADEAEAREEAFRSIHQELEIHTQLEEEIFYPAVADSGEKDAHRIVREALEAHRLIRQLLQELAAMPAGHEDFGPKMKLLKENFLRHAQEEQEEIFPIFDALPKDEKEEAAERMMSRRREISPED